MVQIRWCLNDDLSGFDMRKLPWGASEGRRFIIAFISRRIPFRRSLQKHAQGIRNNDASSVGAVYRKQKLPLMPHSIKTHTVYPQFVTGLQDRSFPCCLSVDIDAFPGKRIYVEIVAAYACSCPFKMGGCSEGLFGAIINVIVFLRAYGKRSVFVRDLIF